MKSSLAKQLSRHIFLGGQFAAETPGQFTAESLDHFHAEKGGQYVRNFHLSIPLRIAVAISCR